MDWLDNKYGLVCTVKNRETEEENSPLWTQQLLLSGFNYDLRSNLNSFIVKSRIAPGLYGNRPYTNGTKEDYCSPDQLIAFISRLYLDGNYEVKLIWEWLLGHWFTYDNISQKTNIRRVMQPSVLLFSAICAGLKVLTPLLSIACVISCLRVDSTSGDLKAWTMIKTLNMNMTYFICNKLIEGGFKKSFNIYFRADGHPNKVLS